MAKTKIETPVRSGWREIAGILVGTLGLMLLLGILSYNPADIGLFHNQPGSHNWIGPFGARTAYAAFMYFGVAGFTIPFCILWIGVSSVFYSARKIYPRLLWFVLGLFCLSGLIDMNDQVWHGVVSRLNIGTPGGLMGEMLAQRTLGYWIGHAGAGIVFVVLLVISVIRMLDLNIIDLGKQLWVWIKTLRIENPTAEEVIAPSDKPKRKRVSRKPKSEDTHQSLASGDIQKMLKEQQIALEAKQLKSAVTKKKKVSPQVEKGDWDGAKKQVTSKAKKDEVLDPSFSGLEEDASLVNYQLPPLDLLDPRVVQGTGMSPDEIAKTAQILQNALEEFGVEAKVTGVQQGPVVTCYEILPAPGVRVERIKALSDNIALKMHAESIRIQAPIPGKGVCGVEVPNATRSSVFFRDMVESQEFQMGTHALPLILGKDTNGESMVFDLAKMPHLLIAGATGAGKSVCMNSILTGLLMKHSPADLRLILVDPKSVEFHQYNNLPHLVVPVITNAKKVPLGLKWAIDEMERRFKWFRMTEYVI